MGARTDGTASQSAAMIEFTIPLRPVTKKNHQQIRVNGKTGKRYIAQSEAYREYEQQCELLIPAEYKQRIDRPVNVKAVYYMPQARRVDLTNLNSALHDVLVKAEVLKDDSSLSPRIVVGTDGSRVEVDRDNPRTEVEITEAGE
ncbi:RusA family crossover junction endodeoxyribonuclease [Ligaoa zhengdingensis]|nr:RusA family crossover junction endodeoxyribonuclease [Ligaoa zhengdingensis]